MIKEYSKLAQKEYKIRHEGEDDQLGIVQKVLIFP